MDAYGRLKKNTLIFGIANLCNKLILVIMVPYYTHVLTTEDLGTADAWVSAVSLISPIITLYLQDAVMRYAMEKEFNKREILSTALFVIFVGSLVMMPVAAILTLFKISTANIVILYVLTITYGLKGILGQFAKGIGKNLDFAISGIISTVILVCSNVLLLTVINLGIEGYLFSIAVSYCVAIVYLIFRCKIWKYCNFRTINKKVFKVMIKYSLPLVPNAIMWWIVNLSDRYMIIFFMGFGANGIYAVANKIPSVINMINGIFNQAWQISAIEEQNDKNRTKFSSNIYNMYFFASVCMVLLILTVIKPLIQLGFAESFLEAWRYIPFLCYAMIFSGMGAFLGSLYAVAKDTKKAMISTIISAAINIGLNAILIPLIGINGAAIATFISMEVLFLFRAIDTRKYLIIDYDKKLLLTSIIGIAIQGVAYYKFGNISIIISTGIIVFYFIVNRSYFSALKNKILKNNKN